jgi:hypothetical protein
VFRSSQLMPTSREDVSQVNRIETISSAHELLDMKDVKA